MRLRLKRYRPASQFRVKIFERKMELSVDLRSRTRKYTESFGRVSADSYEFLPSTPTASSTLLLEVSTKDRDLQKIDPQAACYSLYLVQDW